MKQVLQSLDRAEHRIADVPAPAIQPGTVLIGTHLSVISPGTERMLQEFGRANWLQRARQQPDKVRMVLDKVRTDGLLPALEAVQSKLEEPIPLGYCNMGSVLEVGEGVSGFRIGDRVASNGQHAEVVRVPQNLCALVPDDVDDASAAFTALGAIALQGIRLAQPTLGETVVVTGLGLVGLITVQLLRAHGCRVLGIDLQADRLALARQFGAEVVDLDRGEDPLAVAARISRGRGVDAALITAATQSNEPVGQAAKMCRRRGRIVLVGVTGLELSRADFYEKELSFQVSCSYGPGRHDPAYEGRGQDYPVGFVRWTEQRNFEAVLDMMADGRIDPRPLISHRYALEQAVEAYGLLGGDEPSLGIVLEYPRAGDVAAVSNRVPLTRASTPKSAAGKTTEVVVGFLGAGNHAGRVLMPAFKKAGATLQTVVSSGGVSAARYGRKFGFHEAATDPAAVLENPDINTVVIATRHDSHAHYVCAALAAGKHVFVEKPLALTLDDLRKVEQAWEASGPERQRSVAMVGFNRRYSPHARKIREVLAAKAEPKAFVMTVNAGAVPNEHWTLDPREGGGRIIGEASHFVDLFRFLANAPLVEYRARRLAGGNDNATLSLVFGDGSTGSIHYLTNGHRSFPKERLEVFCGGSVLQLDNFKRLKFYGGSGAFRSPITRQDKGHLMCVAKFIEFVLGNEDFEPQWKESLEVSACVVSIGAPR